MHRQASSRGADVPGTGFPQWRGRGVAAPLRAVPAVGAAPAARVARVAHAARRARQGDAAAARAGQRERAGEGEVRCDL